MLPFLKSKKDSAMTGLMVKTRAPDETPDSQDQDDPSAAKEACGQAILDAIKSGSAAGLADAMQDMYDMCQSGGDEESAPSPHTYQAQNEQAGQE